MKMIFIMVDGFGVPPEGWSNSIYSKYCDKKFIRLFKEYSIPVDACLGVQGLPQSATGQCALFTGINAAERLGRHVQGFPSPSIVSIIRERNIFSTLTAAGKKVSFANAYVMKTLEKLKNSGMMSVTSVMTEHALGQVLMRDDLADGKAVFQNITREGLAADYGFSEISPSLAAEHLAAISDKNDFTLFEYFMTDRAGHKRNAVMLKKYLGELSEFVVRLSEINNDEKLLVLTSDHGNCEDDSSGVHTLNPVPLMIYGDHKVTGVKSILDIYDWIVSEICG
ncbi:MAG: hypothetical protein A2020_14335 [Lentisphaerae bacterium GWF2_45_14]|nr:MAG: hypothetical protein A2020_14335 [Lentisphaerae bacterium GWF2_45_14]